MTSFVLFAIIKFNLFIQEKKIEEYVFELHVKHELRMPLDNKNAHDNCCTIKTFLKEYKEAKENNYPNLCHAYHFGYIGRCCTIQMLEFNRLYQSHCKSKMENGNQDTITFYSNALIESEQIYKCYDLLDDAFCDGFSLIKKRKSLNELKKLIGEENFYKGLLPPIVPVWRFQISN